MISLYKAIGSVLTVASVATAVALPQDEPTMTQVQVEHEGQNITFNTGYHDPSDPRRNSHPPECSFEGNMMTFYYSQVTGIDGTACFGWSMPQCHAHSWGSPHFEDIQHVLSEQVKKDGQWESSEVGAWMSTFFLGTTAFDDRNTAWFDLAFASGITDRAWNTYFWSRNGNYASIHHSGFFNCP